MKSINKQPLYNQLVDVLKEKIETEMEANSMLPSERELSAKYGLSRTTVRLALQELENLGYIYKQHGRGTFVSSLSEQTTNLMGAYSFTEQMLEMGKMPDTTIIGFETIEATKYLSQRMNLSLGDKLIQLKRLRSADDMPMMVETSYLPLKKFMTLSEELLNQKPLYDLFSDVFNEVIKVAEEEFSASIATEEDAKLLDITKKSAVLHLLRTTYNIKNEVIEFTFSVARADQFRYKIQHVRQ